MDRVPRSQQNSMQLRQHEEGKYGRHQNLVTVFASIATAGGTHYGDAQLPSQRKHYASVSKTNTGHVGSSNITPKSSRPHPCSGGKLNDEEEFPPLTLPVNQTRKEPTRISKGMKRTKGNNRYFRKSTNSTAPRNSKQQSGSRSRTSVGMCHGAVEPANDYGNNKASAGPGPDDDVGDSARTALSFTSGVVQGSREMARETQFCGGADECTEAMQNFKIEKLAVGNGRPLHSRNESVQSGRGGGSDGTVPNPDSRAVFCGKLGHSFLSFHDNGVEIPDGKARDIGCQTGSSIIESKYSPDRGGTFQVWFIPDPELSEFEANEQQRNHGSFVQHGQLRSDPPSHQSQLVSSSATTKTTVDSDSSPSLVYAQHVGPHQQCVVDLRITRDFGNSPEDAVYAHYEAGATHSNGSTDSREDFQNWASPYSPSGKERELHGHPTAFGNSSNESNEPAPRRLQFSSQSIQDQLFSVPQTQGQFHFQENVNGIDEENENNAEATFELNVYRSALQLLEAGVIPQAEPGMQDIAVSRPLSRQGQHHVYEDGHAPMKRSTFLGRQRQYCKRETELMWRGKLLPKDTEQPCYSEKIFVGGIQPEVTKANLYKGFQRFNVLDVSWCASGGENVIPGCAYVTLGSREQVSNLIQFCRPWRSEVKYWKQQRTWHFDIPHYGGITQVEVIMWDVNQAEYVSEDYSQRKSSHEQKDYTVFVGNLHARFSANDLRIFLLDEGFLDVKHIKIGMDKHEYPVGYGKVTFGTFDSFIRAVRARKFIVKTIEFTRVLQIEPFIEGNPCSLCTKDNAVVFCRNDQCSDYFCHGCYTRTHDAGANHQYNHTGDIVTRPRRPRNGPNSIDIQIQPHYV